MPWTCYTKYCDKVLVLPDNFMPFSGVSFCVMWNSLDLNYMKKNKNVRVQTMKYYTPLNFLLLIWMSCWIRYCCKYIACYGGILHHFHYLITENDLFMVLARILGYVFVFLGAPIFIYFYDIHSLVCEINIISLNALFYRFMSNVE